MTIIADEIATLLDEIAAESRLEYLDPVREVTIQQVAERMNTSIKRAEGLLNRKVRDGELEMNMRLNPAGNHIIRAYRKPAT